ncbi:helix-turn-helix transcriptional regulator [Sphingobacterium chungjuense]|uniref:helix-turn-helix transcriptional regulator n=1 Tax=Sphingobacterium chungjuense TaxID=2675553 RepID=UPI00140DE7CC|nr:YafY family protein [Sphingobacterium chungjuense]
MSDIKKRFDRILSIYIHLQTKRLVTSSELANRFNVSVRTIYRDVQSLLQAGIPIYGEAGTGYSMMPEFRLPAIPFTREEALSFVAAEKLVSQYTDKQLAHNFTTAISKMKALLRYSEKQHLEEAHTQLLVQGMENVFNQEVPDGLSVLIESIVSKRCVHIRYQKPANGSPDERIIEPVGVFIEGRFWYVMAYCQLRQDYRQFRLDRIHYIRLTTDSFAKAHQELAFYLAKKNQAPKIAVIIRVDHAIARYLNWDRVNYGFTHETVLEDAVEMHFQTDNLEEYFARWFLMFADQARVVEPASLRDRIGELIATSQQKWRESML